jgi:tricorn protease
MYERYLPQLPSRQDLNFLLQRMFSHLAISHMAIGGGDSPSEPQPNVGLLGVDYAIDSGRYRFALVLQGDNESQLTSAPLAQPGLRARAGEYLLEADGEEVKAERNVYSYFVNKAGRSTRIRVGPRPDGGQSREMTVTPLAGENSLRESVRFGETRRRVEEASGGRLGYIYLPDTSRAGYEAFLRDFYANVDKQGLIIDERYNGGGFPADFFVETLGRRQLSTYAFREGDDLPFPAAVIPGPRVMIINESAGSGGDTLPWMFRRAGVGTLVGTRTSGAGIGGFVNMPSLVDGGRLLAPNRAFFDPASGALDIENHGVKPDIEVELAQWPGARARTRNWKKRSRSRLASLRRSRLCGRGTRHGPFIDRKRGVFRVLFATDRITIMAYCSSTLRG